MVCRPPRGEGKKTSHAAGPTASPTRTKAAGGARAGWGATPRSRTRRPPPPPPAETTRCVAEVERASVQSVVVAHLTPVVAEVNRVPKNASLRLDERVDVARVRRRRAEADATRRACGQAVRQLLPGAAAVNRTIDAACRAAALQ